MVVTTRSHASGTVPAGAANAGGAGGRTEQALGDGWGYFAGGTSLLAEQPNSLHEPAEQERRPPPARLEALTEEQERGNDLTHVSQGERVVGEPPVINDQPRTGGAIENDRPNNDGDVNRQILAMMQQINNFSQILNRMLEQQRGRAEHATSGGNPPRGAPGHSRDVPATLQEWDDATSSVRVTESTAPPLRTIGPPRLTQPFRFGHGEPPFSLRIMEEEVPRKMNLPKLEQYDGTSDPEDHLAHYQNCMALQNGLTDAILCRAFITSLKGAALSWFHRLPPRSVDCFAELAESFVARFIASKRMRRAPAYLLQIKQQKGESLRQYVSRFSSELTTIDGCGDEFIVTAMARGLLPGRLADSMLKNPPTTTTQMLEKAQRYIKLEEFRQAGREEDSKDKKEEAPKRLKLSSEKSGNFSARTDDTNVNENFGFTEPIDRIFYSIKDKIKLRYPQPMRYPVERRDKSRFCDFHNEVGHRTAECKHLIWELENLAKEGFLDEFLKVNSKDGKPTKVENSRQEKEQSRRSPRGKNVDTIYVIHAETEDIGLTKSERKRKLRELYTLTENPLPRNTDKPEVTISFSEADLFGVKYPHDDPLVVTIRIAGFNVRRVLIDNGSSVNILFHHAFKKMMFEESELVPSNSMMTGFSGETSMPLGSIKLPTQVGEGDTRKVNMTNFFIIKSDSPYNGILGRTWLHDMKALASSYHQCLKYPIGSEIGILLGNQLMARECLTSAFNPK